MRHHRIDERGICFEVSNWLRHGARLAALTLGLALLAGCDPDQPADTAPAEQPEALADDAAKASYSLGYRFAENVRRQFPGDIQREAFVRGVRDQLAGNDAAVDDAEAERVLTAVMEARQAEAASEALENLEEGLAFLQKNGTREEVTSLESGLQYEVLEAGEGAKPASTDTVTTHYEGRLIDGTVFDSSYQRGEPASFPLNRVIPGWTEGLQLMSPGAKYRLYVPADLAYGDRAAGAIPPNSTLIFEVELLEVASAGPGAERTEE
jgi:FKBP-type peptidyl-prolyl cis-trans isomerase